jgi:hypothetical protein
MYAHIHACIYMYIHVSIYIYICIYIYNQYLIVVAALVRNAAKFLISMHTCTHLPQTQTHSHTDTDTHTSPRFSLHE